MRATEDSMTATAEGVQAQTVLAVDISKLDTSLLLLVTAVWYCVQQHLWYGTGLGSILHLS